MSNAAVHWHDGMFLSPHHFQAAERHARKGLRESEDWFHPFAWGVRGVRYDDEAIASSVVSLLACEARFKDGTHLSVGPGRDVPSLSMSLRDALKADGATTILLAVRSFGLGEKNVDLTPIESGGRYWADEEECEDENKEAVAIPLKVRRFQAKLLHSGESVAGYETLPILRVQRSGTTDATPRVVAYVPPLLSFDAWPRLVERIDSLAHQIQAKATELAGQIAGRGLVIQGNDGSEAERLLKLGALNEALPPLRAIIAAPGVTPFAVYLELCRIVGRLGLFLPERMPAPVLPYDHEDIGGRFLALIDQIRQALKGVESSNLVVRHFARDGDHLRVALEESWLQADSRIYLGIETDRSEAECDRLLTKLDRSIGAGLQVEELYARRVPGLTLTPLNRHPVDLQNFVGVAFFEIGRDARTWAGVVRDRSLAIRLNMAQATFQSGEIIRMTTPEDKGVNLRFALYVVPGR